MILTATELSPIVALVAGILILIIPRLLNFIVAIYLIFIGFVGLTTFITGSISTSGAAAQRYIEWRRSFTTSREIERIVQ